MPLRTHPVALVLLFASQLSAHGGQYPPLPQPGQGGPSVPQPSGGGPSGGGGPTTPTPGTGGGGHYGGPGDVVQPGSGRGPASPRPSGPTAPQPSGRSTPQTGGGWVPPTAGGPRGPATGGPSAPAANAPGAVPARTRGPATGGGMPLEPDFDTWEYWWECNKNGYLRLRDPHAPPAAVTGSDDFYLGATRAAAVVDSGRPTRDDALRTVMPELKRALDATTQRDITSSCMVALAKIGLDHPEFRLVDVFAPRLRDGDQEVRETAALSLGIAARVEGSTLDLLAGLALDDAVGRAARGGEVDQRTRAYATYGLGLAAHRSDDDAVQLRVLAVVKKLLDRDGRAARDVQRDLQVAALHATSLLRTSSRTYAAAKARAEALDMLTRYFVADLGAGDEWMQAHCPTAIARLVGRDESAGAAHTARFLTALADGRGRRGTPIAQSCALALGQMALPDDTARAPAGSVSDSLLAVSRTHVDRQTRHFALIALARIGGDRNRDALLRELTSSGHAQRLPWCALALGVLEHERRRREPASEGDAMVAARLHETLQDAKEPGLVGALGIALGLCRATASSDLMRERMLDGVAKEEMAGYLAIGLALMEERRAVDDLRRVLREASRRPELMVRVAIALGRLGDRATAAEMVEWMAAAETNLAKVAALSAAIGQIGDRRSLEPLIRMLHDPSRGALARAFAAVALGGVCDPRPLPWNTPIGADVNYRAAVPTLTDQVSGVLDIL